MPKADGELNPNNDNDASNRTSIQHEEAAAAHERS